jgi:hypothetical protein
MRGVIGISANQIRLRRCADFCPGLPNGSILNQLYPGQGGLFQKMQNAESEGGV